MKTLNLALIALASPAFIALCGCSGGGSSASSSDASSTAPAHASMVGQRIDGGLMVRTETGRTVTLESLYASQPVVLEFYRGSWCPYCIRQLTEWQSKTAELNAAGGKLVAVSLEKLEGVKETVEKTNAEYLVVSDYTGRVSDAFDLTFDLSDGTVTRYKGFGLDLEASNESGEWELPRPGTYVIDTDGVVRYEFRIDDQTDYQSRSDPNEAIAVVSSLNGG